ncbi:MAG: replicative DNA helicase [Puniceicoccaceae bacterium]
MGRLVSWMMVEAAKDFKGKEWRDKRKEGPVIDRTLPHNSDAEQGVLACCVRDSAEILSECLELKITSGSFYNPAHALMFEAMLAIHQRNQPVDEIILLDEIEKMGRAAEIGGLPFINQISERIETTAHARYWIDIVKEQDLLRRLIRVSSQTIEACYERKSDINVFLGEVEQEIYRISQDQVSDSAKLIREPLNTVLKQINDYLERRISSYGIKTGFLDFDQMTFGLHPTEMIVLAARPSVGKTSLAMNIAENVSIPKGPQDQAVEVLVFSLEMGMDQLAMRLLCGRAGVSLNSLRDGMVSKDEKRELARAGKDLQGASIHIDDSASLNILEMRAKARRLKTRCPNLGLVIIDYLQLVSGTDNRVQREQQIAEISRGIKAMAKELNLPVIVLSQLNREMEKGNREPRMSDLRESGSIEQDADVVMLLHRPKSDDQEENFRDSEVERIKLILAKQRNGPTGVIDLIFRRKFTRFENYSREDGGI